MPNAKNRHPRPADAIGDYIASEGCCRRCLDRDAPRRVIEPQDNGHYTVEQIDTHKQMTATPQGLRRINDEAGTRHD